MLETLKTALYFFEHNYYNIFVYTVIMVSAIIVAIGLLKPVLFNKIKSKHIRKAALAFTSVALCFICILVIFLVNGYDFRNYVSVSIVLSVCCIVTYWLYENTNLRSLIETIGKLVLRKIGGLALLAGSDADIEQIKNEAKKATAEIKNKTKTEIKNTIKKDKDLEGL